MGDMTGLPTSECVGCGSTGALQLPPPKKGTQIRAREGAGLVAGST